MPYSKVSFRMILSIRDLKWVSEMFNDMKHREASLRQLSFLFFTHVNQWPVVSVTSCRGRWSSVSFVFVSSLRARERITFKLCLLVYKARNGIAPDYIQDLCVPVSTVSTRSALRSAARRDLVVPHTRRRLVNRRRSYGVERFAARHSHRINTIFKNRLKTRLFLHVGYLFT